MPCSHHRWPWKELATDGWTLSFYPRLPRCVDLLNQAWASWTKIVIIRSSRGSAVVMAVNKNNDIKLSRLSIRSLNMENVDLGCQCLGLGFDTYFWPTIKYNYLSLNTFFRLVKHLL